MLHLLRSQNFFSVFISFVALIISIISFSSGYFEKVSFGYLVSEIRIIANGQTIKDDERVRLAINITFFNKGNRPVIVDNITPIIVARGKYSDLCDDVLSLERYTYLERVRLAENDSPFFPPILVDPNAPSPQSLVFDLTSFWTPGQDFHIDAGYCLMFEVIDHNAKATSSVFPIGNITLTIENNRIVTVQLDIHTSKHERNFESVL